MRKLTVVAVLVVALISSGLAFAFQNEPEGFRGLKWGNPPPGEDMEDWTRIEGNDLLWYERKNDKLQIGGAKLKSIEYQFYKGQFIKVWIKTKVSNYEPLEDVVKLNFGMGYSKDYSSGDIFGTHYQDWLYQWSGDLATVILKKRIGSDKIGGSMRFGYLTIRSTKIYNQYEEDMRRKKEEEARRKEEERRKAAQEGLADFDYIPETKEEENKEPREALEKPEIEYLGPAKRKEEEAPKSRSLPIFAGRKIERQVEPPYPEWAQREGITSAVVEVKCLVLPSGDVRNVEVCQSSGSPRLDEHVCQYLLKWKFEPIEGQEVQWGIVPFHFKFPEK